ncbi:MAG: hypothetical protein U0787_05185 [Polyangia bacterium]
MPMAKCPPSLRTPGCRFVCTVFLPGQRGRRINRRIIFSSNNGDPRGREFGLWAINADGSQLEQITFSASTVFPIFRPTARPWRFRRTAVAESRGETNVFVADLGEVWFLIDKARARRPG